MIKLIHITTVPQTLNFFTGQIGFMKERGFEVLAISSPDKLLGEFCCREGIRGYAIEMQRAITPHRDLVAAFRLARLFRRIRPAIVHAHTPKAGLLAMLAAAAAGVPVRIFEIHGLPQLTATGIRRTLLNWGTRIACRLSHRVLCVSHSIRAAAVSGKLVPEQKIAVAGNGSANGVDADGLFNPAHLAPNSRNQVRARYGISPDALVMGFVGRLVRDKGMVELVAAWNLLRDDFPNLHWLLVGDFEPHDPLSVTILKQFRTDARIHRTGWSDNLPELYSAMDLLVLPSYREGFPVVALEGAAMALPVVATRVPGCADSVDHGITGTLIEPRDPRGLASAIRAYLTDPQMRALHGEAGRKRTLLDFQPQAIWRSVQGEYARLLHEKCAGYAQQPTDRIASAGWGANTL